MGRTSGERREPEDHSTTRELLLAAESGREEAWHALYLRYRKVLRGMIRRRLPRGSHRGGDTEDVLQSTFVAAWRALDEFEYRGPDSFKRWLATILNHKVVDHAREQERRERGLEALQAEIETAADDDSPSTRILRDELHRRLLQALTALPLEDQELIGKRYFDRASWGEVAARMNVSTSTAMRRTSEALERLWRQLG